MMNYENQIKIRINQIANAEVYDEICLICSLSQSVSDELVCILLQYACQSQNELPILIARKLITELPQLWLVSKIYRLVEGAINLNDEWEYRRFLEISKEISQELLLWGIEIGIQSKNEEIVETATDFKD